MNYKMKEMPASDRPREKMLEKGAKYLTDYELLAIIIQTGNVNESAVELCKKIIYTLENLNDLTKITPLELMKIKGIKQAKACQIAAAIELGVRILTPKEDKKLVLKQALDVYHFLELEVKQYEQEHLIALYLDTKLQLITKKTIYIGSLNQVLIHPREIFKYAVKYSAYAVILAHNHPSGDANPSKNDCELTTNIKNASKLMQIMLVDHVIIGKDHYFSMAENQLL